MVTFEEMNFERPNDGFTPVFLGMMQAQQQKGLLRGD